MDIAYFVNKHGLRTIVAGAFASSLVACATTTTPQLADARNAYEEAESSPARTRAPGDLADARAALDRAEQAHDQSPGSDREVELAERAARKARYAEARGDARAADRPSRADARTEREIARERAERLDRDRSDRTVNAPSSPRHANAALQSLAQVGSVRQDTRGVVITLSGSLLFPTGEQQLSPIGNQNVDRVAHALAQQPKDTTFEVEGYTDSSGSDAENRQLSERRAQAVADRLTAEGIDPSRIRVVGRGEDQPIADNDTNEGRASNRRVEIVVNRRDRG